jgi:hypothetical protein
MYIMYSELDKTSSSVDRSLLSIIRHGIVTFFVSRSIGYKANNTAIINYSIRNVINMVSNI